jgi:hypothetical protein
MAGWETVRLQSPRPFASGATLTVHLNERYAATTLEVVRLAIAHVIAEKKDKGII